MTEENLRNWEVYVGRFILETGTIELRLLQLYWNVSIGGYYDENVKNDSFSQKIKRLRKDLKKSNIEEPFRKEILNTLNRCSGLIKTRNLVAHNPLSMDIFFDAEGLPKYEPLIRSLRNNEVHLTERNLLKGIEATRKINEEFIKILPDQRLWSWREV